MRAGWCPLGIRVLAAGAWTLAGRKPAGAGFKEPLDLGETACDLRTAGVLRAGPAPCGPRGSPAEVDAVAGEQASTPALFALTSGAVQDKVADEFRGTEAELIRTNLSDEQEAQLREAFGLED